MKRTKDGQTEIPHIADVKGRRSESPSAPAYLPPPLPTVRTLSEQHVRHLQTSALTTATLEAAQLFTVELRTELCDLLGRNRGISSPPAIAFPFFLPGSDPLLPFGFRTKADVPRLKDGAPVKYDQPRGEGFGMVYFPPLSRNDGRLRDVIDPLYICEGEKKALLLDQEGYATIGVTGCWMWADFAQRKIDKGWYLHPSIREHVTIADRRIIICYDADVRTKDSVLKALRKLAETLEAAGAAEILIVLPPEHQPYKGIDDYAYGAGLAAMHTLLREAAEPFSSVDPRGKQAAVTDTPACAGAPVPDGLVMPKGFQVAESGRVTSHIGDRTVEVSQGPILIAAQYTDAHTGECFADLAIRALGRWTRVNVSRKALTDARVMTAELGPVGAPMHGGQARYLLAWFAELEAANAEVLAPQKIVNRTGWIGFSAFMSDELSYSGDDPGYAPGAELSARIGKALTPRGTLEAHLTALRAAWAASPAVRVVVCAALAAPLLTLLGQRGFAVHLYGDSSRGKTTMLQMSASVFGDPADPGWVGNWNTTPIAAELRAQTLNDLPLFFDELGQAARDVVQRLIYTLINGEGRARATRDVGLRTARAWRTVVISSGEISLGSDDQATGAQARVLDLCVSGFGKLDGDSAQIAALTVACERNAGQLGAAWLGHLVGLTDEGRQAMVERLRELRTGIAAATRVQGRQADYQALLQLVEEHMIDLFGFAGRTAADAEADTDVVDADPDAVGGTLGGDDRRAVVPAGEAMARVLVDWIASRPDAFGLADQVPGGGFVTRGTDRARLRYGVQVIGADGDVVETLIVHSEFKRMCNEYQKSHHHVLADWAERGWIEVRKDYKRRHLTVLRTGDGMRGSWISWIGPRWQI
jgi:hypothetical protein